MLDDSLMPLAEKTTNLRRRDVLSADGRVSLSCPPSKSEDITGDEEVKMAVVSQECQQERTIRKQQSHSFRKSEQLLPT